MPRRTGQRAPTGEAASAVAARGAVSNPGNRFERLHVELTEDDLKPASERPVVRTEFFHDHASTVITRNSSPDLGFELSLNPYRGCEHGCSYCYARPYHEFLGFSAGLDFESRILVKTEAARLLERELSRFNTSPGVLVMSGVTDPYQPVERRLEITRRCLAVLAEFRQPVSIITKNALVTRDIDWLSKLAAHRAVRVTLSLTTLDSELSRRMEPRASLPHQRLDAIRQLNAAGIPAGVNIAPLIPGFNDHEVPSIVEAAAQAGAVVAGWGMLRLPHGVKDVFLEWLDRHFPGKKARVLARIREVRQGRLNDNRFQARLTGEGIFAEQIRALFQVAARHWGLDRQPPSISGAAFRRPGPEQLELCGIR